MQCELGFHYDEQLISFGGGGGAKVAVGPPVHVDSVHEASAFDLSYGDAKSSFLARLGVSIGFGFNVLDTPRLPCHGSEAGGGFGGARASRAKV